MGWNTPSPPASETAATSSGFEQGYIGPQISGTSTQGPSAGSAVSVELSAQDPESLAGASQLLATRLRELPSLVNVDNSYADGKPQLDFRLRDEARAWGLTSTDVARSIRSSFFGAEALREQRGRNEV